EAGAKGARRRRTRRRRACSDRVEFADLCRDTTSCGRGAGGPAATTGPTATAAIVATSRSAQVLRPRRFDDYVRFPPAHAGGEDEYIPLVNLDAVRQLRASRSQWRQNDR